MSDEGYLYCFSNECMPSIFNIGMTINKPTIKLSKANEENAWNPPMPYKIQLVKKVKDPKNKFIKLQKVLHKYRINSSDYFFKITLDEINNIFDLIEGEVWTEEKNTPCRDMSKCFDHGQAIRHKIGDSVWIGYYDKNLNKIILGNKQYNSPSGFSADHYNTIRKDRTSCSNGWKECEYEVDVDEWMSIYSL